MKPRTDISVTASASLGTGDTVRVIPMTSGIVMAIRLGGSGMSAVHMRPPQIRRLIDALEPLAAPRAVPVPPLPALVGTEWLTGADPAPPTRWRVEYYSYWPTDAWTPSKLERVAGRTFATREAAATALKLHAVSVERLARYRIVPCVRRA